MGKIDTITKDYMRNSSVFAGAFNYFIYGGEQVIQPESLRELDTEEIAVPFGGDDEVAVQKFRDLLKAATFMADDKATYLVLGVENESGVRFAEPVKVGLYDFLQYSEQVRKTALRHREEKDWKGHETGEFLSGFYREDRLTPVITLVILFSPKNWDGPKTLHEMMSLQDPEILKYAADYRLNLIEPAAMEAGDLNKLRSNLRSVLGFIKYSDNGEELDEFLLKERGLEALDVEAARVIKACARTEIEIEDDAKVVNMCKAEREMKEKARLEGKREGRLEGRQEGRQEGRLEALSEAIQNAMEAFHLNKEEAMKGLKISKEDQAILMKMI